MRSLVKPHTSPSPSSPPLKGGERLQPSPLEGESEGEGTLLMNSLVMERLDIHEVAGLVRYAIREGIIQ